MRHIFLYIIALLGCTATIFAGCDSEESYTRSSSAVLTFSQDTVRLDTVFAGMGSSTKTFWVFNNGSEGLRLSSVRLLNGGTSGFRVNVDGSFLDTDHSSQVRNLELRHGDSLRVFVEVTPSVTGQVEPQAMSDKLVFTLESGVQQQVQLEAWGWDAVVMRDVRISNDSLIENVRPVVIYGGLRVDSGATLTIRNTTLFFHDQAGIDVYGRLLSEGNEAVPVVMRGDRLDRMFDYLPYNNVSGQWRGLRFHSSSTGNIMQHTQIISASDAVVVDSAAIDSTMQRLTMERCIVHNAKGEGVSAVNANISLNYCQLSNTLGYCLSVYGGSAVVEHCTLAQFYPLSAYRAGALLITNSYNEGYVPLTGFLCMGSIITGYDDDVMMGVYAADSTIAFTYRFDQCLLRTPRVETADSVLYTNIIWDNPEDSIQGEKHFRLVDSYNMVYDFHLDSLSTARGLGCYVDSLEVSGEH